MRLYKFKIWDNLNMLYVTVKGKRTWYTKSKVARAFDEVFQTTEPSRYEVHKLYLTTVCVLE